MEARISFSATKAKIDLLNLPVAYSPAMDRYLNHSLFYKYLMGREGWQKNRDNRDCSQWEHRSGRKLVVYKSQKLDTWKLLSQVAQIERRGLLRVYQDLTRSVAALVVTGASLAVHNG